jgi:hypothetical protein
MTRAGASVFGLLISLVVAWSCGARSELDSAVAPSSADGGSATATGGAGGAANGGGGEGGDGGQGGVGGVAFDDCTDPDVTYIYLVTVTLGLYAYKPQLDELEYRGDVDCATSSPPFSMAVSRRGKAHVIYNDGSLWEVDLEDATCKSTPYVPAQLGFTTFGMGYAVDDDGQSESLYVADIDFGSMLTKGLGRIDLDSYTLTAVAPLNTGLGYRIELTANQKQLHAFIIDDQAGAGHIADVDKNTGVITNIVSPAIGTNIGSWHFAVWGGDFFLFTESGGQGLTTIRRYNPITTTLVTLGTVPEAVVGAGASTCAPQ